MKNKLLKLVVAAGALLAFAGCEKYDNTETAAPADKNTEVTLYVVRHGKTMLNTTDRVQGWSDAVLTPAGEEVVSAAGRGLKDVEFDKAYSSDSGRAMQTANLILAENAKSADLKLESDKRLREFNFGTYEGDLNETMWTDIAKSQGKTLEEWQSEGIAPSDFANSVAALDKDRVEEGVNWPAEDYATITKRLKESVTEIAENASKSGDDKVLIVSHGLSISALIDTLFDGYELPAGGLKNASVTEIKYKDGKFELGTVNDLSYIEKGTKK
ncbi:phosphoglycerate mutase [Lactococcus hodotermopsidis]|uniref:Phosphoglycerate mutase n=1 Tax=Pseudolactococcus hodotermopsidis TaxID=2709157 RepID=A0A6A0BB70_9LACT|nr:histidine phosphatase family protein [Lactococcus hodotermopsidis]GFH41604.1 phosphoglycerate mutase [Lactococcus hodotermopsidis]